jgi:hypothetical protein
MDNEIKETLNKMRIEIEILTSRLTRLEDSVYLGREKNEKRY